MDKRTAERMSVFIVGFGAVLAVGMYVGSGAAAGRSAALGAALAAANWFALRYLVGKVVAGSARAKPFVVGFLLLKMGALFGLTGFLLVSALVLPIPFVVGLSSLPGGLLFGSFLYIAQRRTVSAE